MNGHKGQIDFWAKDGKYVGSLSVRGDGTPKTKLDINRQQLKSTIAAILEDANTVGGDVNPILFTPSERALLATEELREAFANDLSARMIELYSSVGQGIELGSGENSIVIHWSKLERITTFGDSYPPKVIDGQATTEEERKKWDGVDLGLDDGNRDDFEADVNGFIAGLSERSTAVQNFMLSNLMNQSFQTKVIVYLDNIIESLVGGYLNLTREQMINSVAKVAVHEAAHTLGLMHTAKRSDDTDVFLGEIQRVTLSNGALGDTFRLSFNGELTAPLSIDAEAFEVSIALRDLSTIAEAPVTVESPGRGGPYTISFQGVFGGLDVPQITPTSTGALVVDVSTIRNGQVQSYPIVTPGGTTDIMYGGRLDPSGSLQFQPGISLDALKVGLHLDWTPPSHPGNWGAGHWVYSEQAQNTIDLLSRHLLANLGSYWDGDPGDDHHHGSDHTNDGLSGIGQEGTDFVGLSVDGPYLHVLDENKAFASNGLDFGTIIVDGSEGSQFVNTLTLRSFGTQPILVESMDLHSPSGAFSLTGLDPSTIIPAGEEREIEVRFDPTISGEHEAWIVLVSNDENLPTRIPLRGVGKSPNADLLLDVPNNNIGGSRMGLSVAKNDVVTLRNPGSSPLTITDIRFRKGDEFLVSGLPAGFGPSAPIILQPGESFSLDIQFAPGADGLRRDVLEVASNDPLKPFATKTFVGTGVTSTPGFQLEGDDYVAVELINSEWAPILRQRSDDAGRWSFTLPINTMIRHMVFDPSSGLISHGFDLTGLTVNRTQVTSPVFHASTQNDSDGDGLPDDIERAIGTGVQNIDSDNDGFDDGLELSQGADPLGGRGLPTGVIAGAAMQGSAFDVVVGTDPSDSNRTWAFVATGFHGLAVLDISQPNQPVLVSELNLTGRNAVIDVDISRGLAVLGAEGPGIHFVDVSDVFSPKPLALRATDGTVTAVQIGKTHVYASFNNRVIAINLDTKQIDASQSLDGDVADLALDGNVLLAVGTNGLLTALNVQGATFTLLDTLPLNFPTNELYLDRGTAYLAIHEGLATVDYRDPSNLLLLSGPDRAAGLVSNPSSYALTGSGLGVYVSQEFPLPDTYAVDVLNGNDPLDTYDFLVRFLLPDTPHALAISHGYAFIAGEESGLQVVNFQSLDTEGIAPNVAMQTTVSDEDPGKVGIQVGPGRAIRIDGRVVDDVLVRSVELWVNNVLVAVDTSYPWTFNYDTGYSLIAEERVIQLRARDTGGNEGESTELVIEYIPDLSAPVLTSSSPLPGQPVLNVSRIDLNFDEALDPSRIAMSGVQLTELGFDGLVGGGDDRVIPISQLQLTQSNRTLTALFDPLEPGSYRWLVSAGTIADLSGNQIALPIDLRFSIPRGNRVQAASGFPADPTLPSANPGQEISFVMNFGPEMARLEYGIISNSGERFAGILSPSRSDPATQTAYFTIPDHAMTGIVTLYGQGVEWISSLPNWNAATQAVSLLGIGIKGQGYRDILPGNGMYAELTRLAPGSDFNLQSRTELALTPGEYELSMDVAGSVENSSFQETVRVTLGDTFSATFTRPDKSPFARQSVKFMVTQPTNSRLTLKKEGFLPRGLIIDNLLLKRVDNGNVILSDSFELPVSDGVFPLQIVPIVRSVDVTNFSSNDVSIIMKGEGIIEGEGTVYRFGNYFLNDPSASTGPDVRDNPEIGSSQTNQYVTLTIPRSMAMFGDISIATAGGSSAPFRIRIDSVSSQAFSGSATDPSQPSANAGQAIEVIGRNLSLATEMVVEHRDDSGMEILQLVNPTWISSDGTRAQLVLPSTASGILRLRAFGSSTITPIQIVPAVFRTVEQMFLGENQTSLTGLGFHEGNAVYHFGDLSVEDTRINGGPEVTDGNRRAIIPFLPGQPVNVSVTTPGGTSHPISSQNIDWLAIPLVLSGVENPSVNGTPANSQVGAGNAGQVITLVGTGFGLESMQVLFPTRNEDGVDGIVGISPLAVNGMGTRAQVRVPDDAITGPIRGTRIGNRSVGVGPGNDSVHRRVQAQFTPSSSSVDLRFSDGGLTGASDESWGLDNVRVLQGASVVYADTFEQPVGIEWSRTDTLDLGGMSRVSGPFSNQVQALKVSGLTAGLLYTLEWDLWVFDTWDGLARVAGVGPDRFLVMADQTVIFNESFSNSQSQSQSYAGNSNVPFQVVPTIESLSSIAGIDPKVFGLTMYGTGFVEGQGMITIGGRSFVNRYRHEAAKSSSNLSDPDVVVNEIVSTPRPNSVYKLSMSTYLGDGMTLDSRIRVTTDGGFFEIPQPTSWTLSRPARINRIESTALRGIPLDPNRPAANIGQKILLYGSFADFLPVEFDAIDDTGTVGHRVSISNRTSTDLHYWNYEVIVPDLATTGQVRLLDTTHYFDLQVVPTLRGISKLAVGQTAILQGTGMSKGDMVLTIDGIEVTDYSIQTNLSRLREVFQIVTFTVPSGIGPGRVDVRTSGGLAFLQANVGAEAAPTVRPASDVGDTFATAMPLTLRVDDRLMIESFAEPRTAPNRDEDYYRMELVEGEYMVFDLDSENTTNDSNKVSMSIHNAGEEWLYSPGPGVLGSYRVHFRVPATGVYYLRVIDSWQDATVEPYRVHIRRLSSSSTILSRIESAAPAGTPARSHLPSANEGQDITLFGNGFRPGERVGFRRPSGSEYITVAAKSVAADGRSLVVQVPVQSASGTIRLETEDVGLFLQIVPKLEQLYLRNAVTRGVEIFGSGFDYLPSTIVVGDQIYAARHAGSYRVDLGNSPMGPIGVQTLGGSSGLINAPDMVSIQALAASGTPAQPELPSANPLQTITIVGNRLSNHNLPISYATPLIVPVLDASGSLSEVLVQPSTVSTDRSQMTIVVPLNAVTGPVGILGDPEGTRIVLQIVPVVNNLIVRTGSVEVNGSGFIEGNGLYRFGSVEVLDGSPASAGVDVFDVSLPVRIHRAIVSATPPSSGIFTLTTAGGTSAPVSFGALKAAALPSEDRRPEKLGMNQLAPIVDEVLRRYRTGELSRFPEWTPAVETKLQRLQWQIIDLPGTTLGYGSGDTIAIDSTAAGWGWFIDPTPWDDLEFETEGDQGEQELNDLLTVLAHELGHILGLDHETEGIMEDHLRAGTRRLR